MITMKLLRSWNACWSDTQIASRLGKRTEVTPREIASDTDISLADRVWVLSHVLWYLDPSAAQCFAVESSMLVAHLAGDEDAQANHAGILNDILQIQDLREDQRESAAYSAASAAYSAAYSAASAESAAYSAAYSAASAESAAASAAYSAAASAAYSAAESAAYSAASAAESAESAASAAASAAYSAAENDKFLTETITRALEWLGDFAEGWEE